MAGCASRAGALAHRFMWLALACCGAQCAFAVQCNVVQYPPPGDAEKAYLAADYARAETSYRAELAAHPSDATIALGLIHALLRQEKLKEAADAMRTALAAAPRSATLIALRGELELRDGEPWTAAKSAQEAAQLDPCNPRAEFLVAHLLKLNSLFATAQQTLEEAHAIDPSDPEIRAEWMMTLPLSRRIAEIESYLASPEGDAREETRRLSQYLERLKATADGFTTDCRLVSDTTATEIPFINLMRDATHIEAFGLDVRLNNRMARLEIDTGASGLFVTAAVARHAGLKPLAAQQVGGVGDGGFRSGYTAWAKSVRIGSLEFHNCAVQVVDTRDMPGDVEGLIGADVFAPFLVTLDYPMRRLMLQPLPPLAGEKGEAKLGGGAESLHDRYIAPEMKDYTKVYRSGPYLMLPANLNAGASGTAKTGLFLIDTGSWPTAISTEAARQMMRARIDSSMTVEGMKGRVEKVYSVGDITLGFAQLRQKVPQVVAFDTSSISKSAGLEISGFLGASMLGQLTIHLDYRDGLVKFDYDAGRGFHE